MDKLFDICRNVSTSKDLENVKKYIKNNQESVNEKDDKGRTILHKLCKLGLNGKLFFKLVDIFINEYTLAERCIYYNYTPLHYATKTNNLELVKHLISCGAIINIDDSTPLLHIACELPGILLIKELMDWRRQSIHKRFM